MNIKDYIPTKVYPYHIRILDKQNYQEMIDEYNKEEAQLFEKFKEAALKELGLHNHPKKDKIFGYAWQQGHSSGFNEVWIVLCDIAELFTDDKL